MQELLERARREGTPLIDGDRATFVWHGEIAPRLGGDFSGQGWHGAHLALASAGPNLWTRSVTLPRDAYIEYIYFDGDSDLLDPLNPGTVGNGLGKENNYFYMPEAAPTPLAQVRPNVPRGEVSSHIVESHFRVTGGRREVLLYRPPVSEACPLLVVFDGPDYLSLARLATMVDNLVAEKRIRPLAMAMIENGGQARPIEYNCSDATLRFVLDDILPVARQNLNLVDEHESPGAHGVLGASMSGLMSLYAGVRAPNVFGRAISQSGAFLFEYAGNPSVVEQLIRYGPVSPLRIWMDVGRFDLLIDSNRRVHSLLDERGYAVAYREYSGGHNYTVWMNDVWRGLEKLFPYR